MAGEAQAEYFVATSEDVEGELFRVFYVPEGNGLALPNEIVCARHIEAALPHKKIWQWMTGKLEPREFADPTIEPRSLEGVGRSLGDFMRDRPGGAIVVKDGAPDELVQVLDSVQEQLEDESKQALAELLGIEYVSPEEDDRPYPGVYL